MSLAVRKIFVSVIGAILFASGVCAEPNGAYFDPTAIFKNAPPPEKKQQQLLFQINQAGQNQNLNAQKVQQIVKQHQESRKETSLDTEVKLTKNQQQQAVLPDTPEEASFGSKVGAFLGMGSTLSNDGFDVYVAMFEELKPKYANLGSVAFHSVCDMDEDKEIAKKLKISYKQVPSGATLKCEKDFFNATEVNAREAWYLSQDYAEKAQEYIKNKYNTVVICGPILRQSGNDDYIMCSAADGSPKYFEFRFDDVRESWTNHVQNGVTRAVCRMNGGSWSDEDNDNTNSCKTSNEYMCDQIELNLKEYSGRFWTEWHPQAQWCEIQLPEITKLRKYPGHNIDNMKFRNFQFGNAVQIEYFVKRYVTRQLAKDNVRLTSWRCEKGAINQIAESDPTFFVGKDDILTCYANNRPIDFVVDDIRDNSKYNTNEAIAGLNCLDTEGAEYDGEKCWGIQSKELCEGEFAAKLVNGAKWDDTLETCVLPDSTKAAAINKKIRVTTKAAEILVTAASTAGAVIAGGTVVAAGTIIVGGISIVFMTWGAITHEAGREELQKESDKILSQAQKICPATQLACPSTEEEKMKQAQTVIETINNLGKLVGDAGAVNTNLKNALHNTALNCMNYLSNCMPNPESLDLHYMDTIEKQYEEMQNNATLCSDSKLDKAKCISIAGAIFGVISNLGNFAKIINSSSKITSLFSVAADKVDDVADTAQMVKMFKNWNGVLGKWRDYRKVKAYQTTVTTTGRAVNSLIQPVSGGNVDAYRKLYSITTKTGDAIGTVGDVSDIKDGVVDAFGG